MNFELSEDQLLFKASIDRFAGGRGVEQRKMARREPGGVDRPRWRALADLGLLALPLSEAAGGLGADPVDCCIAAMALGEALAVEPWVECAFWPLRIIEAVGGGGELAVRIASGEVRAAVAFAEPGRRFGLQSDCVRARRSGSGWSLDGTKTFVLGGEGTDLYLVTARTEDGNALFAVEPDLPESRSYSLVDGGRAAVLTFRDVVVAEEAYLGLLGAGLSTAVAETSLVAAAEIVGIVARLFDDTVAYVRERRQFGRAIGSFQAIQHRLVDCYVLLEQMRSTLWRAALVEREPSDAWRATIAGGKAFIGEGALHIGHEAIQLHGAMGMSDELAIGHAHKRVLLLSRLFGDPAAVLGDLARAA